MSHSFNKIWVHSIWSTKNRHPMIHATVEQKVFEYMYNEFLACNCPVRIINGMPDHVHCLFLNNPNKALADVIKQVKGSTAHWINANNIITDKFAWQTGYAAYSVSESVLEKVHRYISVQKEHHKGKTFSKEYDAFIKLHGLINDRD